MARRRKDFLGDGVVALALLAATSSGGAEPLTGTYNCFVYLSQRPVFVGGVIIEAGRRYRVKDKPLHGAYTVSAAGLITWNGPPPLGFPVAQDEGEAGKFRMYPAREDVGNKWKGAICSRSK